VVFRDVINCRQLLQKFNRANRLQCFRYSLSHNCVLIHYENFLPLDVAVMLLEFMLGFLMYADDLLLISSTCSDLRRMLRTVFSKPTVYNTLTFNTAVFF